MFYVLYVVPRQYNKNLGSTTCIKDQTLSESAPGIYQEQLV